LNLFLIPLNCNESVNLSFEYGVLSPLGRGVYTLSFAFRHGLGKKKCSTNTGGDTCSLSPKSVALLVDQLELMYSGTETSFQLVY
jgi:hypothetical protein